VRDDDSTALLVLLGLYLWSRYELDAVPAIERAGARAYDALHQDAGHVKDLPRSDRMLRDIAKLTQLAKEVGFPNPELAAAIAMAESGGQPGSVKNDAVEHSVGLWQINIRVHPAYLHEDMLDPVKNAQAALEISKHGADWRPWTVYRTGAFKRYLP
jgi:hypothetical protein